LIDSNKALKLESMRNAGWKDLPGFPTAGLLRAFRGSKKRALDVSWSCVWELLSSPLSWK
jgi:hypothetical protein